MKSYVLKKDYRHWKKGATVNLRDAQAEKLRKDGVVDKPAEKRKPRTGSRSGNGGGNP